MQQGTSANTMNIAALISELEGVHEQLYNHKLALASLLSRMGGSVIDAPDPPRAGGEMAPHGVQPRLEQLHMNLRSTAASTGMLIEKLDNLVGG